MGKTLFEKIWEKHVVRELPGGNALLYIDRHLVHEVTSPQAFEGLRLTKRKVRRPKLTFATMDHNVPTDDRFNIKDPVSRAQVEALEKNCKEFGVILYDLKSELQGIVHIIGPELGLTLPGTTVVCGDSHTSTHGAFGTLAFGIGTSEVEHVLATQCLTQKKPKTFKVEFTGRLASGVTSKDMVLKLIGMIGTAGGTGHVLEYCGEAVRALSMEARMTVCNMSIEAGARAGMIAPDDVTYQYIVAGNRPFAPKGAEFDKAVSYWKRLPSDPDAAFDREVVLDAAAIAPTVTWGTSPEDVIPVTGQVPLPATFATPDKRASAERALDYMGLTAGQPITQARIDRVFIGSCTNSRIEDLRAAAAVAQQAFLAGRLVAPHVTAMVVPGSGLVKEQAEAEGLDAIFKAAGFDWREPGCSMCLGMNPDRLAPGERCASTSNRNFEGRQGRGGRTHLMSPAMAAAAAIAGHIVDVRTFL